MQSVQELGQQLNVSLACRVLGVPRSSLYRARQPKPALKSRSRPGRALSLDEQAQVWQVLDSERFRDRSPRQVYATLLDDDARYLCHWRTMYRILNAQGEVRERRNQLQHPHYRKPELLAKAANQVWSWDITKLKGPAKWRYYYLYVILDIFSRYVVGWLLAEQESATLAEELIAETCAKQSIKPAQLTLHADRGSSMRSKTVAQLLADLGVTKTHTRPYRADDNPYSEAQFKTMKYRPDFPQRFGSPQDARQWVRTFFKWYNHQHRHSNLALMTPAVVHYGLAPQVQAQRRRVLHTVYAAHPERFVQGRPSPPKLSREVWINPPQTNNSLSPSVNFEMMTDVASEHPGQLAPVLAAAEPDTQIAL